MLGLHNSLRHWMTSEFNLHNNLFIMPCDREYWKNKSGVAPLELWFNIMNNSLGYLLEVNRVQPSSNSMCCIYPVDYRLPADVVDTRYMLFLPIQPMESIIPKVGIGSLKYLHQHIALHPYMKMRCAHTNCGVLTRKPDIEPWPIHEHSQRFESFLAHQVEPICYSPGKAGSVADDRLRGGPAFPSLQRLNGQLVKSLDALTVLWGRGGWKCNVAVTGHWP